ncbi:Coiled-coil and C2 domain-containing protein 2A [Pseudolycoriella hygida]|uniref:Coiled-coil and C2 domain-containing protein 2A n=1 Tax=Pseudolycoriella hygida TaxID=35572 RepID=A0A9Q0MJJ4_9DIPT|nr:Coiled-coil and C2 domain-containing protein 2A [Pseudolycoriella hygida]
MLNSKKRRRKKKKSENLLNVKKKVTTQVPEKQTKSKPKLNQNYKKEELEVQSALSARKKTDSDLDTRLIDRQVSFFVYNVDANNFDEATDDNGSEQSLKTDDNALQLASSFVQIDDESPVEKCKKQKIVFADDDLLYFPRHRKIERKIEDPLNVRDDGLYEPIKPRDSKGMLLQLNRFKEENSSDWLTESNQMVGLKNFVQSSRLIRTETSKEFTTIPYASEPFSNRGDQRHSEINREKILKIHIHDVTFHSHPYLNKEQILARNIESLYKQYTQRRAMASSERLLMKLTALRRLQMLTINEGSNVDNRFSYKNDIRDLRNHLHRNQRIDRDILTSILEQWKSLKKVRKDQGFTSTNIKLSIRTDAVDESADREMYDRNFELELNEIFEESMEDYLKDRKHRKSDAQNSQDFELIKKLVKPDIEIIREQLMTEYSKCMRPPGEPLIFVELNKTNDPIDSNRIRNNFANSKFLLQISFDKTKLNSLRNVQSIVGDRIILDAIYSVKFRSNVPTNIRLIIYEEKMLKTRKKCAQLIIPVPNAYEVFKNSDTSFLSFESTKNRISGKIGMKIGWSYFDEPENRNFFRKNRLVEQATNKIQSWYDDYMIDPLDPEARSLIEIINKPNDIIEGDSTSSSKQFRLNENIFAFCKPAEQNTRRLNILTARFNSHLRFKDEKFVPLEDREIYYSDGDHDDNIIEDLNWLTIDVQRHKGKKYLLEVFDVIKNHCEIINKSVEMNDLLIGDNALSFSALVSSFMNMFGPKRPLNPLRKHIPPSRVTFKPSLVDNFKVIVNVLRASGVPHRQAEPIVPTRRSSVLSSNHSQRSGIVNPFVVVQYKGKTMRTSTAEGSNPTWNEQMVLSTGSINSHHRTKDYLCLQMFDEQVEDLFEEDRMKANEIYQKVSSKWLAEIRIPFYTIYSMQRIEGIFEMTTPSILLGYTKQTVIWPDSSIERTPEIRSSIYLTISVSLEPLFDPVELTTSNLECTELANVKNRVQEWYYQFMEEFPSRCQDPFVSLSNGKRVCITRLVGPIELPFENNNIAEFLIRRFVAMIPVLQIGDFCTKLKGIWLTNDQMMTFMTSSAKDLGVLLCCYYLSLGYRAFLALGSAFPNGDTTFVLIKENGEYVLVDPFTGKKYSATDVNCTLTKVYCLINNENIWANIQKENRVYMTKFDVINSTFWRPCFNKSHRAPTELVHDKDFQYTNSDDVSELIVAIEQKIVKKISSWRTNRKTIFNRSLNETLREILVSLEEDICYEYEHKSYMEKLNGIASSYKICGHTLNTRYTNLSDIVSRVKATLIHSSTDNRVEFSLGVHIQPYPNNVLSVWIFLLSLVPKF